MDNLLDPKICCIKGCENESLALGLCNRHWRRNILYGSPVASKNELTGGSRKLREMPTEKRFWLYVNKTESCWLWKGAKANKYGYGRFYGKVGEVMFATAHRYSYALHKGHIPKDMYICHSCDTPACVNPDHLFLGTPKDNVRDMIKKQRHRINGEPVYAKITKNQAQDILLDPRPYAHIAQEYGIATSTVNAIKNRYSWKELEGIAIKRPRSVYGTHRRGVSKNLNPDKVREIRASQESYAVLAAKYNISRGTVRDIRCRRSWKHVT